MILFTLSLLCKCWRLYTARGLQVRVEGKLESGGPDIVEFRTGKKKKKENRRKGDLNLYLSLTVRLFLFRFPNNAENVTPAEQTLRSGGPGVAKLKAATENQTSDEI